MSFGTEEACLRMGHKCWGIFDDKCDTVNLMLVDGYIDVDESRVAQRWPCLLLGGFTWATCAKAPSRTHHSPPAS